MFRRLVVLAAVTGALSSSIPADAQDAGPSGPSEPNQLIVRLDRSSWPDAESIVARIKQRDSSVVAALGSPADGYLLVQLRIVPQLLKLLPESDARVRLHNAIVLTFGDRASADAAEGSLRANPAVLEIERVGAFDFASKAPNDPLLTNAFEDVDPQKYQWAAQRLNLFGAWSLQRGYGYVGLIDNGIQIHGLYSEGIHEDLLLNYRPQFSYNFGHTENGVYDDSAHGNPRHGGGANQPDNLDEEPYNVMSGNQILYPNIAGHGTHTAGIIAAQANNGIGVAGACQGCSLALARATGWDAPSQSVYPNSAYASSGVTWMTNLGAQAINLSFQGDSTYWGCTTNPFTCASLKSAIVDHDVAVVAAAGNGRNGAAGRPPEGVDFPASYTGVIAVAGAEYSSTGVVFWDGSGSFGSNRSARTDIAAPAKDVISSVYTRADWNTDIGCGDIFPSVYYTGYGDCVGTSMAAPHVTAIVQLYRSTKPTAPMTEVVSALKSPANVTACGGSLATYCGAGVPEASKLVQSALGASNAVNRLTPLFSFYSSDRYDHFYTVAPQMGSVAILGTILPKSYTNNSFGYGSIGQRSPGYSAFPGVPITGCGFSPPCDPLYPRAMVSVFTTFKNPLPGGPELVPLYRLSYACPSSEPTWCTNHEHVSHVYATDTSEQWISQQGYKVDGIEGYVFPKSMAQPPGAVKLCRKYYSGHDDYILFAGGGTNGADCSAATDGYTPGGNNYTDSVVSDTWIGWVYTARAPQTVSPSVVYVTTADFFLFD